MSKPREVYLPVHVISCSEKSECPYFEVVEYRGEVEATCVAFCKATGKYLTKSFARKCIASWETCPFKQITDSQ
ncbi:MAG: hypothetical protein ACPLQS_00095 [Desulfurococcaceae archaeon]